MAEGATATEGPKQWEQGQESRKKQPSSAHSRALSVFRTNAVWWEKGFDNIIPRVCWNLCVTRTTLHFFSDSQKARGSNCNFPDKGMTWHNKIWEIWYNSIWMD